MSELELLKVQAFDAIAKKTAIDEESRMLGQEIMRIFAKVKELEGKNEKTSVAKRSN